MNPGPACARWIVARALLLSAERQGAFTSRRNLVVGPLAMIGAGGRAYFSPEFGGQKFQLLVRAGHRVALELPRRTRPGAGLAYGPFPVARSARPTPIGW